MYVCISLSIFSERKTGASCLVRAGERKKGDGPGQSGTCTDAETMKKTMFALWRGPTKEEKKGERELRGRRSLLARATEGIGVRSADRRGKGDGKKPYFRSCR